MMMSIVWLFLLALASAVPAPAGASQRPEIRQLRVGEELTREKLALRNGRCIYELLGLESSKRYEVKISYPASIPAIFSLRLVEDVATVAGGARLGRKLLNTEKITFGASQKSHSSSVLVSVRPEGVVGIPGAQDQEWIVYNILCEEVIFGLPKQSWWMGLLLVVALVGSGIVWRHGVLLSRMQESINDDGKIL